MKFTELPLSSEVLAGIDKAGFSQCTMVQERVLPTSLKGKDVMVQSKTGSGKTAVFLLTILQKAIDTDNKSTALVIAPTRELAVQIEEDAKLLSSGIEGYKVGCFYGGVGYKEQNEMLQSGLNLYVGTPGRLLDFAMDHKIDFRQFSTVVLDEADRMFDMGFYPDIQRMFSMMVAPQERQTMLFSATLSTKVRNLAWQYMTEPEEIEVQPEEITVKKIKQELYHVTKSEKFGLLLSLMKKNNPKSCLIFTNTKDKAVEVSMRLNMNGYKSAYLMGDMPQAKRLQTIDKMKDGQLTLLVATDVAARGLQIDDLELVINYDIPEDFENYVHRIGRTARAGKSGKSITLACEEYIYGLQAIEDYIQMKVPVLWADEENLEDVEDKSAGYKFKRNPKQQPNSAKKPSSGAYNNKNKPSNKPVKKAPAPHANTPKEEASYDPKAYDKLSKMTLEERMAYYKKEYTTSASAPSSKANANKTDKKQASAPKKPVPQSKPAAAKPKAETIEAKKAPKVEKKGLLAKIKAFFKRG